MNSPCGMNSNVCVCGGESKDNCAKTRKQTNNYTCFQCSMRLFPKTTDYQTVAKNMTLWIPIHFTNRDPVTSFFCF